MRELTPEELKNELIIFKDKKDKLKKITAEGDMLKKELSLKEDELSRAMRQANLDHLPIKDVGNFKSKMNLEVYSPKTIEDKKALFEAIKEIVGTGGFLAKVTIPHMGLNGMINKMQGDIKAYVEKNKVEGIKLFGEDERNLAKEKREYAKTTDDPVIKQQLNTIAEDLETRFPYLLPGIQTTAIKFKLSITKGGK